MTITDADKAYHSIKERIVTVQLQPGAIIQEARLMEELNLGRTPIREALRRLQAENLVEVAPRRGVFVADISLTDLQKIFEVRVEIESLCARLAAERMSGEMMAEMHCLIAQCQARPEPDKRWLLQQDRLLHQLLARGTGNEFLYREFEQFYNLSIRIWHLALNRIHPEDINIEAHGEILKAVEARDSVSAGERMREHIHHFHQTIKQYL
ncbi:MAG: GntR family transcriptional regulator [Chloroflexi bacterium]|nr:MAG: GntR family transcriptional regulator [Chloroflexota bacterium]